jgi:hypothetical protein
MDGSSLATAELSVLTQGVASFDPQGGELPEKEPPTATVANKPLVASGSLAPPELPEDLFEFARGLPAKDAQATLNWITASLLHTCREFGDFAHRLQWRTIQGLISAQGRSRAIAGLGNQLPSRTARPIAFDSITSPSNAPGALETQPFHCGPSVPRLMRLGRHRR